jgi:catechol 2,3-dioxygenase-like lactoylglutathione lyase family enzyme
VVAEDFAAARTFYDAVCAAVGLFPDVDFSDPEHDGADSGTVAVVGYRTAEHRLLLVVAAGPVGTRGAHLALAVAERGVVDHAVDRAEAVGASVLQRPRPWEERQLGYYGAQLADPAGNLVELVHRPPPS